MYFLILFMTFNFKFVCIVYFIFFHFSEQATSTQSLMIIRCCGSLVPEESPEVRTKLVNEIWSTFEKIGKLKT